MNTTTRTILAWFALLSLVFLGTACSGTDSTEQAAGDTAEVATGNNLTERSDGTLAAPEAALASEAFKNMAASQGIHLGEVPEDFPLDFLPLYPGGDIDKSAVRNGTFTLLQVAPADQDTVLAWYRKFYAGLGWSPTNPVTAVGRTMTGFQGRDAKVDMTLLDREEGKTFVALAMSPK